MKLPVQVRGSCMTPLLDDGDILQVHTQRWYWPGDVVVFRGPAGGYLVHRVLGVYRRAGQWRWLTRADRARYNDAATPHNELLGKVMSIGQNPLQVSFILRCRCLLRFVATALKVVLGGARAARTRMAESVHSS